MLKIVIQPLALIDLEEIWFYTYNKWSSSQAKKYSEELNEGILQLANELKVGFQIEHIKKGYWKFQV